MESVPAEGEIDGRSCVVDKTLQTSGHAQDGRVSSANKETLPSLSSVIQSAGDYGQAIYTRPASQRDTVVNNVPSANIMSPPSRSFYAQRSESGPSTKFDGLRFNTAPPTRPSLAHLNFYSILDTPRADGAQVRPQSNGSSTHTRLVTHEGSGPLFWAAAPESSVLNSITLTGAVPRPDSLDQERNQSMANPSATSTSSSKKRQASLTSSPPILDGSNFSKPRRTQPPPRAAVNAPGEAWLRPAPPRIRDTTKWTFEREQWYKEGYSDAMDDVKREEMGCHGETYCDFVFWRYSPATVVAETPNESGMDDDDLSSLSETPYSEDRSPFGEVPGPITNSDSHRGASGSRSSRQSQQEQTRRQAISCWPCRKRKLKCGGEQPCGTCARRPGDQGCVYEQEVRRRGKGRKPPNGGLPAGTGVGQERERLQDRIR